jgi:hypothetical protein
MGSWDDYCTICAGPIPESCGYMVMYLQKRNKNVLVDYMSGIREKNKDGVLAHPKCCKMIYDWFGQDFCYCHVRKNNKRLPLSEYHCQFFELNQLKEDGKMHLLTDLSYLKEFWSKAFTKKESKVVTQVEEEKEEEKESVPQDDEKESISTQVEDEKESIQTTKVSQERKVNLICIKKKGKLRVRITSHGYLKTANCQFPRDIRKEGMCYSVNPNDITLVSRSGQWFYSIRTKKIDCGVDVKTHNLKETLPETIFENIDNSECVVCMEAAKQIVFIPCAHYYCCDACSSKMSKCPVCRSPIEKAINKSMIC